MNQKRQPRGVPVGGQFDSNEHDEAGGILHGGRSAFDRIGQGDTLFLPWDVHPEGSKLQGSSLFRDYDGRVTLITQYPSPLDGDWDAHEWAKAHEHEYDDFLAREYGVEREYRTARILIETPVDEDENVPENDRIRQAFLSDVALHYEREVESGEFLRKVKAMVAADTIGSPSESNGDRADMDTATAAADDYYVGNIEEIDAPVARTLAAEFTRGTNVSYPHLENFARNGWGSAASMLEEANRIDMRRSYSTDHPGSMATSEGRDRRYTALLGFLMKDQP